VSGLLRDPSLGGWCVWIMACCLARGLGVWIMVCCLARRMMCLDYGVLSRKEDGVSGLWRAVLLGG
jgi:hypothetical protein